MSYVIRLEQFGGLKPSASARLLPDQLAQVANNLDPATMEFRPLAADTQVVASSGASNPLTLYRLDRTTGGAFNTTMTTGWIVRAADISYVRGQIAGDVTERTYATFNDASQAPRVYDVNDTTTGRQLGVPAPTVKPTITVNVVDEFTTDERASEIAATLAKVTTAIREALRTSWLGAADPAYSVTGYVNLQDPPYTPITQAQQARVYRLSSVNGANNGSLSNTYSSAGPDSFTWIWDSQVSPFLTTSNSSSPAWQGGSPGSYFDHLCIGFHAYGKGYTFDAAALAATIGAIPRPGATAGEKLLTTDQITGPSGIVTRLQTYVNPDGAVKPKIDALKQKVSEIKVLLDGGATAAASAQMTSFYAKTDVAAVFTAAIANIAEAIFAAADNCFRSSTPADSFPGGGGG